MSQEADGHSHSKGGVDWFRGLDLAVWAAVTILVILACEWLLGRYIRESLARGAQKHLASVSAPETPGT